MTARTRPPSRRAITAVVLAILWVAGWPGAGDAFKWHECPTGPLPVYPSAVGATVAPFIHPGHDLTIVLNETEEEITGGFSLAPDGNRIAVVFRSLFGDSIVLPELLATATTASSLTFPFVDTQAVLGRSLAGPVEVTVYAGEQIVARIDAADLVALPPASDIAAILLDGAPNDTVLAALGADGHVWIPAAFSGEPMEMPFCEGNFILPVPVQVAAAPVAGDVPFPFDPLGRLRRVEGYLGDMVIEGTSFYGMRYPERILPEQIAGTLGVSICRLNDAADLVIRVYGDRSWADGTASPFRFVAADSTPLSLALSQAPLIPARSERFASPLFRSPGPSADSFGNTCAP